MAEMQLNFCRHGVQCSVGKAQSIVQMASLASQPLKRLLRLEG